MRLAVLACVTAKASATEPKAASATRPNIVILFMDDVGWGDVHYRRDKLEWPQADRLMRDGVTFPQAYAASPTCSPSRGALITGQHAARLKLVRHIEDSKKAGHPEFSLYADDPARMPSRNWLPLEEATLAEALKPLGYRTAFVGKWHLGHEPYYPVHQGFDEQYGVTDFGHPGSYTAPFWKTGETYKDVPAGTYLDDRLTEDAIRFLERQKAGQPFLLTLFYYGAHSPFQGRKDLLARFEKKGLSGAEAHQAALCAALDESLGRIRESLARLGLEQRTVLVFCGDQGSQMSNAPLRGGKPAGQALYEGGARVPLTVCWPGALPSGQTVAEPVVTTDVFPTILQLAGGDPAAYPKLDGRSLVPLLRREKESLGRDAIFMYRSYDDQYAAVRAGDWKLIAYRSGKSELFNLADDLSETNNLAARNPAKTDELRRRLDAWESEQGVSAYSTHAQPEAAQTGVSFRTADAGLQRLFDAAEAKAASNIVAFAPALNILVEGGGYQNAWIETQPMGGEMYAKRNLEVALNNQTVFMLGQRADGRLPGMVISGGTALKNGWDKQPPEGMLWVPESGILADYEMFQGFCFPDPAWKMYFWIGKDRAYLERVYAALEKHDAYLWRTRDSNGDGLLETWCVYDTGEDFSTRLLTRNAPTRWPFDCAPIGESLPDPQDPVNFKRYWGEHARAKLPPPTREQVLVPFASMDFMAYSYDGRATLAKIARELGNARESFWRQQAEEVRQRLIKGLWDSAKSACYDRDRHGRTLPELVHNNIRCLYYGIFTQEMADAFIRRHLLNPAEFWTPVPLPSIAVSEPLYRNNPGNDWSGQPMGLTYQRAIRGLENYGHYAEVTLLGRKWLDLLVRNNNAFMQQFDARTGLPSGISSDPNGYGPTLLAALEYVSRLHGVHLDVENGRAWWSALADAKDFAYTQRWGDAAYTLTCERGQFRAERNGKRLLTCTAGVRVVTDLSGNVCEVVGIASEARTATLRSGGSEQTLTVKPNEVYRVDGKTPALLRAAPFDYPCQTP